MGLPFYNSGVYNGGVYNGGVYDGGVYNGGGVTPSNTVKIGDNYYEYVQIGNRYFLKENIHEDCPNSVWYNNDEETARANKYGKLYKLSEENPIDPFLYIRDLLDSLPSGWRLPTRNDGFYLRETYTLQTFGDGSSNHYLLGYSNETKFDGVLCGFRNKNGQYVQAGQSLPLWTSSYAFDGTGNLIYNIIFKPGQNIDYDTYSRNYSACPIRFCKDVE